MHGGTDFLTDNVERAIFQDGRRAGFEPERARTWGWFVLIVDERKYWQWCEPCSSAETMLMQLLFGKERIYGEPRPTRDGYCVLAAQ